MGRRRPTRISLIAAVLLIAALGVRIAEVELTSYSPTERRRLVPDAREPDRPHGRLLDQPACGRRRRRHASGRAPTSRPAFPYLLAAVDLIGGNTGRRGSSIHPARLSQAVIGTAVVAFVGLVAFELFDAAVALIALGLAAFYPVFVELSAALVAENLMTLLILAAVWMALRGRRSQHPYRWIAAAGVLTGLATLTHVNSLVVIVPLAFAAWHARRGWRSPALLVVAALLTVTPWLVRNAVVMHRFIFITDEAGITLRGTYNSASAANRPVPYKWRIFYGIPGERPLIARESRLTEPELSSRLQSQALHYIADHPLSPFEVAYHNSLRLLELEGKAAWRASAYAQSIPRGLADAGSDLLLDHRRAGARRGVHPPRPRGAAVGVGDPAAAVADGRADQRGDAAVPRADRRVPDPVRRVRAGRRAGGSARPATSSASRASAWSGDTRCSGRACRDGRAPGLSRTRRR